MFSEITSTLFNAVIAFAKQLFRYAGQIENRWIPLIALGLIVLLFLVRKKKL